MEKQIEVWVCPTPECSNFYGASGAGDLARAQNRRSAMRNLATEDPSNWGRVTSTRDECPDCRARGAGVVRRVRCRVAVALGEEPAAVA